MIEEARRELGIHCGSDRSTLMAECDAVVVATAPDSHVDIAKEALELGLPVFIEKPISHNRTGVDDLTRLLVRTGTPVEVGCQLRHHPVLQEMARRLAGRPDGPILAFRACVGQRLDQWRPGTDHRAGFSADATRGGGALFELVHELDLVQWILGPVRKVQANLATVGDLDIRADDLANLTLTLESAAVGQVQIDMISPVYRREFEVVCQGAIWRFDYVKGELHRVSGEGAQCVAKCPDRFERNDLFLAHMRYFLDRVQDHTLPASCSLEDGVNVLNIALAARRSHNDSGAAIDPRLRAG